MNKYIGFLLMGMLMWVGCSDTGVNPEIPDYHFFLEGNTPIPGQNSGGWWTSGVANKKSKKDDLPQLSKEKVNKLYKLLDKYTKRKKSPYAAFLSQRKAKKNKKNNKKKKFKYRYFKLHPPQKAIEEAGEEKTFYFHIFVDPSSKEVYQILAVLVPDTPEQLQAVKEWGDKLNSKSKSRNSAASKYPLMTSCSVYEGLIWVPECGCFGPGTIEICEDSDDSGGGGGGDGDGDDPSDCYYDPGGCEEDEDPDHGGGGGGDTGDTDPCPTGQVEDPNGNCVMGETPCVGNPIKNPRIAAQTNSGIEGGRKGFTRSGGSQFHSGLDLKNDAGKAWFSPVSGNIDAVGEHNELGHYVTIRFEKNGVYYTMQFGHLQKDSWPPNGSTISAGDVIGIQSLSGNLEDAIIQGDTNDVHSHIIVRKRTGTGWDTENDYGDPLNPEQFIKTKFDANGSPIAATDC